MTRTPPNPVEPTQVPATQDKPASPKVATTSAPGTPAQPKVASPVPSSLQEELDAHEKAGGGCWQWIVVILMAAAVGWYLYGGGAHSAQNKADGEGSGRSRGGGGRRGSSIIPVVTEPVKKGDIDVVVPGIGNVTPLATVTVKSRVDGELIKINYTEGQMVKEGDLLAQIDPRPFQVALAQVEGQLMRDQALLKNAKVDLERYQGLWKKDAIPQITLTQQESLVAQYEGTVKSDQAAVDNARLNLTYCNITSPLNGRVGLRLVDQGNMIRSGDSSGLVVITQIQPTTVVFPINADMVPAVLAKVHAGETLRVEALDKERANKLAEGKLLTVDNAQDSLSGTLKCKAIFDNKDLMLYPNRFVNADLYIETKRGVTLVNPAAIQRGGQSPFVYILKPDNTVTMRNIETGVERANAVEVLKGLEPGEIVVTAGVDKLLEGSKVTLGDANSAADADKQGGAGADSKKQKEGHAPGAGGTPGTSDVPGAPNIPASSGAPGATSSGGEGKRRHRERAATNSPASAPGAAGTGPAGPTPSR
ncbi:MAG TPA: efflux RND transporter periplasmic adaptor subunit [Candidatus Methylacidiphilales bacterium]|nr:efflux RND transporter periplasmic adaptor subunit [Candidatus Methylacidiphilales bacterium]